MKLKTTWEDIIDAARRQGAAHGVEVVHDVDHVGDGVESDGFIGRVWSWLDGPREEKVGVINNVAMVAIEGAKDRQDLAAEFKFAVRNAVLIEQLDEIERDLNLHGWSMG